MIASYYNDNDSKQFFIFGQVLKIMKVLKSEAKLNHLYEQRAYIISCPKIK